MNYSASEKKLQKSLQRVYDELEIAKELNSIPSPKERLNAINTALSSLLDITEELDIEITI